MSVPTYHGVLEGVTFVSGRYRRLLPLALGSVPGVGLVTAATERELLSGGWSGPVEGAPHVMVRRVWYRRARPGYGSDRWYHDVTGTAVAVLEGRVSFLPAGAIAHVCDRPTGDFICGG